MYQKEVYKTSIFRITKNSFKGIIKLKYNLDPKFDP